MISHLPHLISRARVEDPRRFQGKKEIREGASTQDRFDTKGDGSGSPVDTPAFKLLPRYYQI